MNHSCSKWLEGLDNNENEIKRTCTLACKVFFFCFFRFYQCMREVKILLYFILRYFYLNRCWRPWLLFALLFFSLFSKYCINIIIAIIIVLLLRPARCYRIVSATNCELSSWCNRICTIVLSSSNDDSSRDPTCFIDLTMTHLWRNICPYILSSRLLSPHPSFIFMYHVIMIGNNCTIEDVY